MPMDVILLTPPTNKFILNNNLQFCTKRLKLSQRRKRRAIAQNTPILSVSKLSQSRRESVVQQINILNNASELPLSWCLPSFFHKPWRRKQQCDAGGNRTPGSPEDDVDSPEDIVDEALHMDGQIPETSDKFVKQVSSKAYELRRQLKQSIESSSYDVLEANPWRGDTRPVYVLAQGENQLWTMRTRRTRSEVEQELGLLFPKQGKKRTENGTQMKKSDNDNRFRMLVEDIREGVLVFEDEEDAAKYCNLLEGRKGQGCAGVAELDASSVFDLCHKMKALAVLFRRGRTHPLPDSLELDLKARKRSLEDQE